VTPEPCDEINFTAKQVIKTRAFWFVAIAFMCHLTVITCMLTHVMKALGTVGFSRSVAGIITMCIPLASIIGRLGFGRFADRYGNRIAVIFAFIILGFSFLFFIYTSAQAFWFVVPFILFFGIGYGANNTLRASIIREYFGRASFGATFGLLMGVMGIGGLIGPLYGGIIYDKFIDYSSAWMIAIGITVLGLFIMLISPQLTTTVHKM
jgi:MFS family permease